MTWISYELSQELKEAGFPQDAATAAYFYETDGSVVVRHPELPFPRIGAYRMPNLSALFDACGEPLVSLVRLEDGWYANDERGATPEEAVAKLWIKLKGQRTG